MSLSAFSSLNASQSAKLFQLISQLLEINGDSYSGVFKFPAFSELESHTVNGDSVSAEDLNGVIDQVLGEYVQPPSLFFRQSANDIFVIFIQKTDAESRRVADACKAEVIRRLADRYNIRGLNIDFGVNKITKSDLTQNPHNYLPLLGANTAEIDETLAVDLEDEDADRYGISMRYRPIWRSSRNLIGGYMLTLKRARPSGDALYGYSALPNRKDISLAGYYDALMAEHAIKTVRDGVAAGRAFFVTPPVQYRCLLDPGIAARYFEVLKDIPDAIRPRIGVELIGADRAASAKDVDAMVERLSAYCSRVMLHYPLSGVGLNPKRRKNVMAVGASAYGLRGDGADLRAKLDYFDLIAKRCGAPLYLTSVDNASVAVTAVNAGYEYLAGAFVGSDVAEPANVMSKTLDELCLQ